MAQSSALPSDVLRGNIRDVRRAKGLTQKQLVERMRAAGSPMPDNGISQIERGKRSVSWDEAHAFAVVLDKTLVRLGTPRADDEVEVLVGNSRLFRSGEFRNWMVFGDAWTPAARGAQSMMRFAYAALNYLVGDDERKAAAKPELEAELKEIKSTLR